MARGRTTRRRRRSLPHGQKSGARIVDLFGGVVDVDRHSVDMGRTRRRVLLEAVRLARRPAGFILTELEVHTLSDKNSPDLYAASIVTVEITESDKLFLPLPQSLSDAVCPLSASDDASLPRQRRHPNGIKIGAPFCGDDGGAADPSNPSRQMRVVVVAWLGVAPCDKLSSSSFTRRASARLNGRPMDAHREIGHSRDRLRFSRVFRLCTGVLGGDRAPWHSVIHVADGEHRNQSISMNRERVRFAAARIARLATGRATPTGPACLPANEPRGGSPLLLCMPRDRIGPEIFLGAE